MPELSQPLESGLWLHVLGAVRRVRWDRGQGHEHKQSEVSASKPEGDSCEGGLHCRDWKVHPRTPMFLKNIKANVVALSPPTKMSYS